VHFAAFEHERSVNLLEFEVSKGGGGGGLRRGERGIKCNNDALVDVGFDEHLDEVAIGHDVPDRIARKPHT
jgi:hypothetical protein